MTKRQRQTALNRYVELMSEHGVDSAQAERYRQRYDHDLDFMELADVSWALKKGLTQPSKADDPWRDHGGEAGGA